MTRRCEDCESRHSALCGALDSPALAGMAAFASARRVPRGATLVRAGDPQSPCATVVSGMLKLATTTDSGRAAILGLLYPGDFIGAAPDSTPEAAAPPPAPHDIVALTDVTLCTVPRAILDHLRADNPALDRWLLTRTLAELDRTRRWLLRMGRAPAEARIADFLIDLSRRLVDPAAGGARPEAVGIRAVPAAARRFELPLSRGEIGDLLGLTIETVSRQMTRLRAAGLIDLPGGRRIVIRDAAGLAAAGAVTG
jgi:CRP/FNR family transcriptional regulator, anaerobic regulatory protein